MFTCCGSVTNLKSVSHFPPSAALTRTITVGWSRKKKSVLLFVYFVIGVLSLPNTNPLRCELCFLPVCFECLMGHLYA